MDTIWTPTLTNFEGPKYKAVVAALRADISKGVLVAGDKLPPVRELAWEIKVTAGTVARAYQQAIQEGLLQARVGRGTFVAGTQHPMPEFETPTRTAALSQINLRNTSTTDVGQARALQAAMIKVAQTKVPDYVEYPEPKEDSAIYEQLCKWMEYSNLRADPKSIVLCHGGQNAISVALASVLSEGAGAVAIDALTYPGVRYAVQNHRAELVGIEVDDFGIVPDALEAAYRRKPFKALFTSTNVLNPTTGEMPLERRIAIADLARKFDFQIIEDDCWGIGPSKLPTFTSICPERAWYLSSISKTISAGLRFGYLVCPPAGFAAASRISQINSYGISRAVSDIAHELLQSGSAMRIRQDVLKAVGKRVELSVNLLGKWDISWRRDVPFIWLQLPQGWRASSFTSACERHDILVRPADEFALNNMPVPRAVRVSVNCNVPLARYEAALRQIDNLLSHPPLEMES